MPAAASAADSRPKATGRCSGEVASATSDWLAGSYTSNASPSSTTATAACDQRLRRGDEELRDGRADADPPTMVARGPHRSDSRPPSSRDGMVATPNAASRYPAWATDAPSSATSVTREERQREGAEPVDGAGRDQQPDGGWQRRATS